MTNINNGVNDVYLPVHSFAISPNESFICGSRKVGSGLCDMFLWVRQKNGEYKLMPETLNKWIVRKHGKPRPPFPIHFVRLIEWRKGGDGVLLACASGEERSNSQWHRVEIDLVHGKFSPYSLLSNDWKFII